MRFTITINRIVICFQEGVLMRIKENYSRGIMFNMDFYQFRDHINYMAKNKKLFNIDKDRIESHINAIQDLNDVGIESILDLLIFSTIHFSNSMMHSIESNRYYLLPSYYHPIPLQSKQLSNLSTQYEITHHLNIDKKIRTYYLPEICKITKHPLTKFYTKVILHYMFNHLYSNVIRNYKRRCKKKNKEVNNEIMIAVLYNKLIDFCTIFDNILELRA